ncbi:MAG TPA: UvrD-helicase domain-containing protein [Ignavibacteria bacterium]
MFLDLSNLNPEQRKAVEEINGPCMIIAGAGSGKTRVLTYKIAFLIESGINPFKILALTFTNKAADEMKTRVSQLSSVNIEHLWIGTFHSMFARMLRIEAELLGYTRNYTIYDSDDSQNAVKRIMLSHNLSIEKISPASIHNMISKLKNKLIYPYKFASMAKTKFEIQVSDIYKEYQGYLRKSNSMDFDDLLLKPIELFETHPEILEKYQNRFQYILVDEYQDTNKAQYIVLKMLASKNQNISVVGDDAQSIYKWRGAEISNIFDFEIDFDNHKLFRLEQNYRSTKKILSFADQVISCNNKQIKKTLWTDNKDGEHITMLETMTDKDEAHRTARFVTEEIQKRKINFKDFAVLYRTNAQSRLIEDAMRENDIPYIIIGGIRFYQRKEIKDVLSYFRIVINPEDTESLIRVLNLAEGIGKTTVEKLNNISTQKSLTLFEVLKDTEKESLFGPRIKTKLKEISNFILKYKYLKDEISLSELCKTMIDEIGLIKELKTEGTEESEERLNNINELISAIVEFSEDDEEAKLEDFLQKVSLVSDIDDLDNKKNAITLMTIHAAKGLEFSVVFITGLEEGLFPVTGAIKSEEELEEERRLFYVAITRAKEKLYISFANQRYRFGTPSYQMKSRFLKEIPVEILSKNTIYDGFKQNQNGKSSFMKNQFRKTFDSKNVRYESIKINRHKEEFPEEDKYPDIKKGVKIYHDKFGNGTVVATSGRGLEKKADIYFDDMGVIKINLKFAKMRVSD